MGVKSRGSLFTLVMITSYELSKQRRELALHLDSREAKGALLYCLGLQRFDVGLDTPIRMFYFRQR